MRIWAQLSSVLSQPTRLTDRWTDKHTEKPWKQRALQYMQSHSKNAAIVVKCRNGIQRECE